MTIKQADSKKVALITGVTGQDGFYLAEFLLEKAMKYMALNAVLRYLIPTVSTICIKTPASRTASLCYIMAI